MILLSRHCFNTPHFGHNPHNQTLHPSPQGQDRNRASLTGANPLHLRNAFGAKSKKAHIPTVRSEIRPGVFQCLFYPLFDGHE